MNLRRVSLIPLLIVAGCAVGSREPPPKPFAGTRWDVVLERPPAGEAPYFRFADGRVEGFGGCNAVSAQYVQDAVGAGAIAVRRIQGGAHACDAAAKAVENHVLTVLQSVSGYIITGDVMKMSGSAGTLVLRAHPEEGKR